MSRKTEAVTHNLVLTDSGQIGLESGGVLEVLKCASCEVACQIVDRDGTRVAECPRCRRLLEYEEALKALRHHAIKRGREVYLERRQSQIPGLPVSNELRRQLFGKLQSPPEGFIIEPERDHDAHRSQPPA